MKKMMVFLKGLFLRFLSVAENWKQETENYSLRNSKLKTENCFLGSLPKTINLKLETVFLVAFFLFSALPAWAGMNEWTSNGPYGGSIESLVISPNFTNDSTVFAGSINGIFKSTNGGSN